MDIEETRWVLYVAHGKDGYFCRGSSMCIQIIENLGIEDLIVIQDCDALRNQGLEFPDWLVGSPTLVDRETFNKYTGSDAVIHLSNIQPKKQAKQVRQQQLPKQPQHPMPPRVQPEQVQQENDYQEDSSEVSARKTNLYYEENDERNEPNEDPFGFGQMMDLSKLQKDDKPDRVTESDVNKFMAERKRLDEARAANRGQQAM